jgi:hypothetical protein
MVHPRSERFPIPVYRNSAGRLHALLSTISTDATFKLCDYVANFYDVEVGKGDKQLKNELAIAYQRLMADAFYDFVSEIAHLDNGHIISNIVLPHLSAVVFTGVDSGITLSKPVIDTLELAATLLPQEGELPVEAKEQIVNLAAELEAEIQSSPDLDPEIREILSRVATLAGDVALYYAIEGAERAKERFFQCLGELVSYYYSLTPEQKEEAKKSTVIKKAMDLMVYTNTVLRAIENFSKYIPDLSSISGFLN